MEKKELTPEELEELKNRHIRSFVMRRGHISNAQKRALEEILPRYAVEYTPAPLAVTEIFGREAPLVLEIGCGMGETTAAIAAAHPEINFLGCEVFAAGVGALAKRLDEMSLTNVRVIRHDAVEVVRDMIAPDSLAGVHIYFPDPWRKARHHKRRLVAQPFIGMLTSRIAPGGYLHCATDWENYAEQMMEVLSAEPALRNLHEGFSPVMGNPLCERPQTKFQARGERLGHGIWDLVFIRK
ncbi:tRNA (guanosine(46)-N7)-methyltransferase TrmB [Sutterella sp.]|uniref:tRNA (guanosine(46)-N7)-methyltransferase TrmB n=1 Tax=Sutterella sp. TaxID=1981025 RepID=UPI0026E00E57|nr:tRNA (guanosine(46)-N7)-methyltransferase TrmB [Sutterella sp.]MDO5532404.1 tRNA (guanosine(46)-N7)-methyltransferase TrmB [Sutterella sp.]